MPKKSRPIVGIQLPEDGKGKRSSTPFNKGVWMAAGKAVDSTEAKRFVKDIENTKNWRYGYMKFIPESMRIGSKPNDCVAMAKAGWTYVLENMEYYRVEGGPKSTVDEAMANPNQDAKFESVVLKGSGKKSTALSIPYKGKELKGDDAAGAVDDWVKRGVVEADTGKVLNSMLLDNKWMNVLDKKVFVLLGALSEMGPLQRLLSWGATVVAIDYCAEGFQKRLFDTAKQYPGTLIIPAKPGTNQLPEGKWTANTGADLLLNFPEVAEWLVSVEPDKEMVFGSFCYLDGEMFIKIVTTMDAICRTVTAKRKTPTTIGFYATPTDCHLVTNEAVESASKQSQGGLASIMSTIFCKAGYNKRNLVNGIQFTDSLVSRQGPNYALAKRLQTWRAVLAKSAGQNVSLNVAPTTTTKSVMKNAIFAFTMEGMPSFVPMEPFETETTKSVMSALLINDCIATPEKLDHPLQILQKTQVHGGMYRTGLYFESMGTPAALMTAIRKYGILVLLLLVFLIFGVNRLLV